MLLRKSPRPQYRVPKREVAQICQQLRCAAAGRLSRSKECPCSFELYKRWAGRRAPEPSARLPYSRHVALRPTPGLLMQPIRKRSAPPYHRTDLRV